MANEAPERIWLSEQPSYWEDNIGTVFLFENGSHNTEYIRADLATLSSEQARDALTELDQLRDRVKELERALEPFANEAAQWTEYEDDEPLVEMWENCPDSALTVGMLRTAHRVREGGKVDG